MTRDIPLILVVDDDRSMRTLLRLALEGEGYQFAEAHNGEQGFAEFMRQQPDMVLLDGVMPVMDGFNCCTKLREVTGTDEPPVLMITVLDDPDSVDQAFHAGATDYITKPIHWAVLRQRVRRLLHVSRQRQKLTEITESLKKQIQRERLLVEIMGLLLTLTENTMPTP